MSTFRQKIWAGIAGLCALVTLWVVFVGAHVPVRVASPCTTAICDESSLNTLPQAFNDRVASMNQGELPASHTTPPSELVTLSMQEVGFAPANAVVVWLSQTQLAQVSRSILSSLPAPIIPTDHPDLAGTPDAWHLVQTMIPADNLERIVRYREASDGPSKTLAYVESNRGVGDQWTLTVDPADAYQNDSFHNLEKLIITLIHELGHELTLNETQLDHHRGSFDCDEGVFKALEGCALVDSYLQKFVTKFWSEYVHNFYALQGDALKLAGFYLNHQSDFINRYASTDPVEDIAESWAAFIVLPDPRGTATANTIPNQKIAFFYQYPELVSLRDEIRGRLAYILTVLQQ